MLYKKVIIVFEVPNGKYCWLPNENSYVCHYLDNEYTNRCTVLFKHLDADENGVLKCKQCLEAKEA
jgi:hypothetical protein